MSAQSKYGFLHLLFPLTVLFLSQSASAITIYGFFSDVTSTAPDALTQIGIETAPASDVPSCFIDNQNPANAADNQIRYGSDSPSFCVAPNSGLGFSSNTFDFVCPTPGSSSAIEFGTFTHFNQPIFSGGDSLTGGTLSIYVDSDTSFANGGAIALPPTAFTFEETPNTPSLNPGGVCPYNSPIINPNTGQSYPAGPNCNDRVVIDAIDDPGSTIIDINGAQCDLVITGFGPCGGGSSVDPSTEFITNESTNNSACLFAQLAETTPVAISHFDSQINGKSLDIDWGTASELFNVGFQLWGLDGEDKKWEKLHGWLVKSGSGNAVEPQSYSKKVKLPKSIKNLIAVGVSSVDSDGSEHYYGPFDVGKSYGNLSQLKPIAWNHIRSEVDKKMIDNGYVKDRVRGYRKVSTVNASASDESFIEVNINESGMYRITSAQLTNTGIDWTAVSNREIAIVDNQDKPLSRYINAQGSGTGQNKTLGEKGEIYFYAAAPEGSTALYTDTSKYRLVLNRYKAIAASTQKKQNVSSGFSTSYIEKSIVEKDDLYVLTSAADDPWVHKVVLSYPDKTKLFGLDIPVEADALWDQGAQLYLGLGRSSELAAVDNDADGKQDVEHIVKGLVISSAGANGMLELGTETATGKGQWNLDFEIEANTPLTIIDDKVIIGAAFNAGPGYAFSEVHVDSAGLAYSRPYSAKAGQDYLSFEGPNLGETGYQITVPDTGWAQAFAYLDGNLVRLVPEQQQRKSQQRLVTIAALAGAGTASVKPQYWVSGRNGYMSAASLNARTIPAKQQFQSTYENSNYLIIAHPAFLDSGSGALSEYANFKNTQGYTVSIVNYLDIVNLYAGGQHGPEGLTRFLNEVKAANNLEHVLLVGSSVYDHLGKLNTDAISFIPGHYATSDYSNFTATDVPYITNENGDLFATIGRWPVRKNSELLTIVNKSMNWSNTNHSTGEALLIAENTLSGENVNFAGALDNLSKALPTNFKQNRVYVDKILEKNPGWNEIQALNQAKLDIVKHFKSDPSLVLYNGHATTSQLSNKGLLKSSDIVGTSGNAAQMWIPMSCYVSYFESTSVNTLAHQLLFEGDAAVISGPSLLSGQNKSLLMGEHLTTEIFHNGNSVGNAMNSYKQNLGDQKFGINWALLGDPTLSGANITPTPVVKPVTVTSNELM